MTGDRRQLTGSDLDLTIIVSVTGAGQEDGTVVSPAKLASDIVRALDEGAVEVTTTDDQAEITSGRSDFSIRLIPAEEFPVLSAPPDDAVTFDAGALADALRQVVPAASSDDSRPILTGVLFTAEEGGLRLVATDSYRLAVRDRPGASVLSAGQSVLVPSRALSELARLLDEGEVTVRLGERDATFELDDIQVSTRLIEGDFPNYKGLIPTTQPNRVTVGRHAIADALRRVRLLAREATPVRLVMNDGGLELLAVTQDVGQAHEQIDAGYEGSELTVAFNPEYLIDGIEVAPGERITIETVDELNTAMLKSPDAPEINYLLMPDHVS